MDNEGAPGGAGRMSLGARGAHVLGAQGAHVPGGAMGMGIRGAMSGDPGGAGIWGRVLGSLI